MNKEKRMAGLGRCLAGPLPSILSIAGAATLMSAPAMASMDEIVVTAQKRESTIKETPMAVTALSGDELRQNGVQDFRDIQYLAPSVHIGEFFNKTLITVRGIGNDTSSISADPGVAVHSDGVYLGRRLYQSAAFLDVERIEVLRGPQGTLYGRNATGGALNVISRSPTDDFEAYARVGVGNYRLVTSEGAVSGPIVSDKVKARLAFKTRDHRGYTPNLFNGERYDDADEALVRLRVLFEPTDNFTIDLSGDYRRVGGFGAITPDSRFDPATPTPQELAGGTIASGRRVNHDFRKDYDAEMYGTSATLEWDFGAVSLKSVSAYRELSSVLVYDIDGSDFDGAAFDPAAEFQSQVSQELNLVGDTNGVDWVLGAFFFREDGSTEVDIPFPLMPAAAAGLTGEIDTTSYAVFGDATWHATDKLDLTFGIRWGRDKKRVVENFFGGGLGGPLFLTAELDDSFSSTTPRGAVSYAITENINAYATVSRGFKAGGFNMFGFQGESFSPEKVTNYEIGLKTDFFDRRLVSNISFFRMDYTDLQVFQIQNFLPLVTNAAEATINGIEFEMLAQPVENFLINTTVTYLDAEFDEYSAPDPARGGAVFDLSGNRLTATPEWAVNVAPQYTIPLPNVGSLTLRGEYSYKSEIFFRPFNLEQSRQEGQHNLNGRLTFETEDERWEVTAWVKNATDELTAGKIQIGGAVLGSPIETQYLPPRTFGVTLGFKY